MNNRPKLPFWSTCAIVAAAAFWQGCAPMKTVTINSTPDKASFTIYHVSATGEETAIPLQPAQMQAPATVQLDFSDQAHYRVEAHHVLCLPSMSTLINLDEETAYSIALTQYKEYVQAIVNTPEKTGTTWQLKPTLVQTVASLETPEPSVYYISQPVRITQNKRTDVDYPSFTTSPAAAKLVYEKIEPDSSTTTGFISKLELLPLGLGENPITLTMGHKQQRFPAFDYSGDNVYFDSNDDSLTDAPFSFETEKYESSTGKVLTEPYTLEYAFSVGKDNLTFAAYGPNSTDPQVEAAQHDGSGQTARATGMSPQLSPDGTKILAIHRPEGGGKLRLFTVSTRGPISIHGFALTDDMDCYDPHWSPDGNLIVFCSPSRGKDLPDDNKKEPNIKFHDQDSEHSFIWIMSADGQRLVRLTRNESFDSNPVFDRNGRTIYFRSNRGGLWNIWKMDLSDNTFTELHVAPPQ